MMFNTVNEQIKKMLASNVDLSPREMEKAKHDSYFVKQYSIGKKGNWMVYIINYGIYFGLSRFLWHSTLGTLVFYITFCDLL